MILTYQKKLLLTFICFLFLLQPRSLQAQLQVVDVELAGAKGVQFYWTAASAALQKFRELPAWERISEVREFLQDASTIISSVVGNLKMTRELIAIEEEIRENLEIYYQYLRESEDFPTKFIHHRTLVQLWYETGKIFEVFDFATVRRRGIINDEGRIIMIKEALSKAKEVRKSMRVVIKKARKDLLVYQKTKREIEGFTSLFSFE